MIRAKHPKWTILAPTRGESGGFDTLYLEAGFVLNRRFKGVNRKLIRLIGLFKGVKGGGNNELKNKISEVVFLIFGPWTSDLLIDQLSLLISR